MADRRNTANRRCTRTINSGTMKVTKNNSSRIWRLRVFRNTARPEDGQVYAVFTLGKHPSPEQEVLLSRALEKIEANWKMNIPAMDKSVTHVKAEEILASYGSFSEASPDPPTPDQDSTPAFKEETPDELSE